MGEGPLTDHNSQIPDREDSAESIARKKRRGKYSFKIVVPGYLFWLVQY